MKKTLIVLLVMVPLVLSAQDIRDKVIEAEETAVRSVVIDPDTHIYGIPFGATEDEFIKACGKPTGYMRLKHNETAMVYGKQHLFLFREGKLSGVRIASLVVDWSIADRVPRHRVFDDRPWRLNNGIKAGMNLPDVKGLLGDALSAGDYKRHYDTDTARVELNFSHYVDEGEGEDAYRIHGVFVEKK